MTIHDAEHLSPEQRAAIVAQYPPHERDARTKGIPQLGSGAVFPVDTDTLREAAFAIPAHWPQIGGMDFGVDHPYAAVSLAWDRDADCVHVTRSYRARHQTPIVHAAALKPWGAWLPWAWPHDGLAHEKSSNRPLADFYRDGGLNLLSEHAHYVTADGSRDTGVEAGVMDMLTRMQTGRFKVAEHLLDWFSECRDYHRKDGRIVKEDDDLMSATRYAVMMLRHAIVEPQPLVMPRHVVGWMS